MKIAYAVSERSTCGPRLCRLCAGVGKNASSPPALTAPPAGQSHCDGDRSPNGGTVHCVRHDSTPRRMPIIQGGTAPASRPKAQCVYVHTPAVHQTAPKVLIHTPGISRHRLQPRIRHPMKNSMNFLKAAKYRTGQQVEFKP